MNRSQSSSARAWRITGRSIAYILLIALCVVMIFPVYWLVATAVKAGNDIIATPPSSFPSG